MSSTLTEPTKRETDLGRLNDRELIFVNALAASGNFCVKDAAIAAGYVARNAGQNGHNLLKKPRVRAALGKVLYDRLERCRITQDEILKYLEKALFFNPLHYFRPSEDGKAWIITDPESIPEEVGILIESLEIEQVEDSVGNVRSRFKVKLVSKSTALSLAMRHIGLDKEQNVNVNHRFEWDKLAGAYNGSDPIQERLSYEQRLASEAEQAKLKRLEDSSDGSEVANHTELIDGNGREPDFEDLLGA